MTGPATAPDDPVLDRVLARLPTHLVSRDAGAGGTLRALLGAVAGELAVLERDLQDLYDGWFVETCAEWLLPYLADLIGIEELPPDLGPGTSRRALVANTIAYRRRKGTVTVLERVAADVTGWPARVVEYYSNLVTTVHLDHVRLDRPATVSVRDGAPLRRAARAAAASVTLSPDPDVLAHSAEVRRIGSGRGRHGLPAVGVFLYPLRVDEIGSRGWPRAVRSGDGYAVDPRGYPMPLFVPPGTESRSVPTPLDPHGLLALLADARRLEGADPSALPVRVRVDGVEIAADALRVAGLEGLAVDEDGHAPPPALQVLVDPVRGRLVVYRDGARVTPATVEVRHAYAASADVGAGTYDRSTVHEQVVIADRYDGDPEPLRQVAVLADPAAGAAPSITEALTRVDPGPGRTVVVSVGDNATYVENPTVDLPAGARLILVAATRPLRRDHVDEPRVYLPDGLRPHLAGRLTVTGGPGSSLVVDGLLIDGGVVVEPGELGALTLAQTTVTEQVRVRATPTAANGDLRLRVVRGAVADVELAATVPGLAVTDSVVEGSLRGEGAHVVLDGTTVRGTVAVRSLDASSCLLDGDLAIAHRQTGALRYTYSRPGSATPRRFRCVPAQWWEPAPEPVYASTEPGAPDHLALSRACPDPLRTGGEDGTEMGVHHHLRRPLRVRAAARALAPYLPVGREIGIFGS
ncbi:phage tail protein [Actinomycetospora flava]|uniref:Phage tail protein n=1 Tax=Actinomycetospora flava TaxID=3129232 RepID=A0ABU8M5G7_9PSEU